MGMGHGEGGGESRRGKRERNRKKRLRRQKIEIKPIRDPEERLLCLYEHREALINKAIELCALTGAQLAIVVLSSPGKPFSFAHPSVSTVTERYFNASAGAGATAASEATWPPAMLCDFVSEYERLMEALEAEARRRGELDAAARAAGVWTCDDVRTSDMPSLVDMLATLERVQAQVADSTRDIDFRREDEAI